MSKNNKDDIIEILTNFATDLLILNEIKDTDKYDKEELKLKKQYAVMISKIKIKKVNNNNGDKRIY